MQASGLMWMALAAAELEELKEKIGRLRSASVELQVNGLLSLAEKRAIKDGLGEGGKRDEQALIAECFQLAAQAGRETPLTRSSRRPAPGRRRTSPHPARA